jgi:hypothetical protein
MDEGRSHSKIERLTAGIVRATALCNAPASKIVDALESMQPRARAAFIVIERNLRMQLTLLNHMIEGRGRCPDNGIDVG